MWVVSGSACDTGAVACIVALPLTAFITLLWLWIFFRLYRYTAARSQLMLCGNAHCQLSSESQSSVVSCQLLAAILQCCAGAANAARPGCMSFVATQRSASALYCDCQRCKRNSLPQFAGYALALIRVNENFKFCSAITVVV